LKIRSVNKGDTIMSGISSLMSIRDLKQKYIDKLGEFRLEDIRLFYAGKELKEDLFIYSYDIKDEMTIQAMIKK
jgi:hypothetical protein